MDKVPCRPVSTGRAPTWSFCWRRPAPHVTPLCPSWLEHASGAAGLVEGIEDVAGAPVFRLSLRGADTLEDQLGRAILRARQSDRSKAS